jgi:hypothetical protein
VHKDDIIRALVKLEEMREDMGSVTKSRSCRRRGRSSGDGPSPSGLPAGPRAPLIGPACVCAV